MQLNIGLTLVALHVTEAIVFSTPVVVSAALSLIEVSKAFVLYSLFHPCEISKVVTGIEAVSTGVGAVSTDDVSASLGDVGFDGLLIAVDTATVAMSRRLAVPMMALPAGSAQTLLKESKNVMAFSLTVDCGVGVKNEAD